MGDSTPRQFEPSRLSYIAGQLGPPPIFQTSRRLCIWLAFSGGWWFNPPLVPSTPLQVSLDHPLVK